MVCRNKIGVNWWVIWWFAEIGCCFCASGDRKIVLGLMVMVLVLVWGDRDKVNCGDFGANGDGGEEAYRCGTIEVQRLI